jgi:hypothetical protein
MITIMYINSQTVFHLTLFNQEAKLPVSVRMQDHHQVGCLTLYIHNCLLYDNGMSNIKIVRDDGDHNVCYIIRRAST